MDTTGLVMGYYDGNTVTGLWNYAQNFALSDNSYGTTFGPSSVGVMNLVSGQTNGVVASLNGTGGFCTRRTRRFADQHWRSRSARRRLLQPDSQSGADGRQ